MSVQSIKSYIEEVTSRHLNETQLAEETVNVAQMLLQDARARQTGSERAQAKKLARMMGDAPGKTLTLAMADQVFRSHRPARIANQLLYLVHGYGVPQYLPKWERYALGTGAVTGNLLPDAVVPFVVAKLRQETQSVILPGEEKPLRRYLKKRRQGGTRLNLNQLGEAILGEGEANKRLTAYLDLLKRDDVEYISVKISSIFSKINLVAYEHTLQEVKKRLRVLYRTALSYQYRFPDGRTVNKFINLDMEEYRDLHFTVDAFQQVLDEPPFLELSAGIVLQAYLPDSYRVQQQLTEWSRQRVARGGAPIKIRLVKGANLAMEQVEASLHDWPQAPYTSKPEVDANFKRMVAYGCQPDNASVVRLGVASHNLFDVAYALLLRAQNHVEAQVEFEMLEGMANHQARTVQDVADGLLLYAPVVKQEDFHSAIAYLVRRLDENTAPENFLHDLFDLQPGEAAWHKQRDLFVSAQQQQLTVSDQPRRQQNRATESIVFDPQNPFHNVSDTDFSLRANQQWAQKAVEAWQNTDIEPIPLQIGGEFISSDNLADGHDPSRPDTVPYQYSLADATFIDHALDVAQSAQKSWAATSTEERKQMLVKAATGFAQARGRLIGCMTLDGGKAITESDGEISEVIDFANYYARGFDIEALDGCEMTPLGTVLITPPWNFPLAIPAGGCLAALMAGNTVIFKPAPEAMLVGWEIAKILWAAGIPKEVLQFVPCPDNEIGQGLVTDARVNGVILTGAMSTAQLFQSWRPDLRLFAETSGKNSLIITGLADHDQAIKDLVRSAFGHAGQKCSAASLGILEAEVYDNPNFLRQLKDAAESLPVGESWDAANKVTPLIRPPGDDLKRALTTLEPGESWLLEPRLVDGNPNLWSPGIKLGVKPNSFFHKTECFGPVLGLMRAENLAEAVNLANAVDFGLTGGIHTLDQREIDYWQANIQVGNGYVNRHITGAIVQRQSFGGWKASVVGPGAKAGGPNYVLQFGQWREADLPKHQAEWDLPVAALLERCMAAISSAQQHQRLSDEVELTPEQQRLRASAGSYAWAWQTHFNLVHDPSQLHGEANYFRYRHCEVLFRATGEVDSTTLCQIALAACTCGSPLTLSLPQTASEWSWLSQIANIEVVLEDEPTLIGRLRGQHTYERLRVVGELSTELRRVANEVNLGLIDAPVLANGRLELRHYLKEQAMSHTYHRYGNILPPPQR